MSEPRKFYVTELTIRVLAEDEPWDGDLQWLSHDVTTGDYVGHLTEQVTVELTAAEMAEALSDAGSDPGFFQLDEDQE